MKYKKDVPRSSGIQISFSIVVIGAMLILTGCLAGLPVQTEKPSDHFDINYIETHQGATRQEVVQELGAPDVIFRSKEKTYYVYDATGDTRLIVGAVFVVPPFFVPFWTPKDEGDALHCLALIFDENGLLQDYIAKTASEQAYGALVMPGAAPAAWPWGQEVTACGKVIWKEKELAQLTRMPQYKQLQFRIGRALAFTKVGDVPFVVVADKNHNLLFWDVRADRVLERALKGHEGLVTSLAVGQLDDTPIVVSGSVDRTVRLWDARSGHALLEPLSGHEGRIVSVAFIKVDGVPTVVSAGEDSTVRMWDPRSGNLLSEHVLEGPPLALGDAGGRPVVFASDFDHSIHLWDVLTGQVMGVPLPGHEGLGTAAAIAVIDGKPILASGGSDNSVRILDARSGKLLREPLYGHKMPITAVAFEEIDGKPVVVSVDENNSMLIWDLIGSELPLTKPMISSGDQVAAVTLLDVDGAPLIAASSKDHTVRLWDGRNGDQLDQLMWADLNMHRAEHENTESQMKVYSHLARTAPGKARYWLCKAAENGHFQAQLELGQWYWRGPKGVPRDIRKAYVWYSLAAEQGGNAWDVWELRAIANQMTREQQAEAEQLLEGYQPGQCERDLDFSNP